MSLVLLNATPSLKTRGIEELLKYIDKNNLEWVYLVIILIYLISIVISWVVGTKKSNVEIKKLKLENSQLQIDITEKCKESKRSYLDKSEDIQILLRLMIEYVQNNNIVKATETREDLKQSLATELIPAFIDYINIYESNYEKGSYKRKEFIENEVLKFLQTMLKFSTTINNSNILAILEKPPYKYTWSSLSPIISFVDENTKFYKILTKKRLNVLLFDIGILNIKMYGLYRGSRK